MPASCPSQPPSSHTTWLRLGRPGTFSASMRGSRTSRRSSGSCFAIHTPPSRIPGIRTACGEPRMVSIRTSAGIGPWVRPSPERSKITFVVRVRGRDLPPEGPNGVPAVRAARGPRGQGAHSRIRRRARRRAPPALRAPPGLGTTRRDSGDARILPRGRAGSRSLVAHPRFLQGACSRRVRSAPKALRQRRCLCSPPGFGANPAAGHLLMSIGPFAIDVLVMAEILFLQGTADLRQLVVGFVAFPILLLAGLLTSLLPGAWLLDALDLRLVNATRGEVIRPAEWFERTLGPVGAVAILVGFVTLLHASGYSYESALFLLGLWAVRLFPAVFGVVCVYRLVIEPQVLPTLGAWCARSGVETRKSLPSVLSEWVAPKARNPRGLRDRAGRISDSGTAHRDRRCNRFPEFFPRIAQRRSERSCGRNVPQVDVGEDG